MEKNQKIFYLVEKVANKVGKSGNWGFTVEEIPLPLLIKQVSINKNPNIRDVLEFMRLNLFTLGTYAYTNKVI